MVSPVRMLPLLAAGAGAAAVRRRFGSEIAAARGRLAAIGPRVVATACGPVEYAERGEGSAVLDIHGVLGGCDQGILLAAESMGEGFRVIAPSRVGYLGSPLPTDATPAAQADAFVALLDALELERVPVVAHSAGATSAVQLALRHADRVAGLALISPNAPELELTVPPKPVARALFGSDFAFWLLVRYRHARPESMLGVPEGYELTSEDVRSLRALMDTMLPARPRRDGALFDIFVSNPEIDEYPLEEISARTLVVGARDDPLTLYRNIAAMAQRIPGAQLLTLDHGGHTLLGSGDRVRREVTTFLGQAPATRR